MIDDLRYKIDIARELVMIHDELFLVRGFTVGGRYFFYVTRTIRTLDWWRQFYYSRFSCYSWTVGYVYSCVILIWVLQIFFSEFFSGA